MACQCVLIFQLRAVEGRWALDTQALQQEVVFLSQKPAPAPQSHSNLASCLQTQLFAVPSNAHSWLMLSTFMEMCIYILMYYGTLKMPEELTVYQPQDPNSHVTACLLGCYTSLYCHSAYQLWTWTRSLSASNWIDIWQNIGAFKIPGIVKLHFFPANSANLSSKDRPATRPRCRVFLTATDSKIFKFSTPIICGKDPETRPFSASA